MLDKYRLTVYDGRRGLIRHVMARRGFATGEILCAIVTAEGDFPNAAEFAAELADRHKNVKSVSRIINNTDTPLWMNGEETVLYGDGFITDILCGCAFRISAKSFYQINPIQTEVLYNTAVKMAQITEKDQILDAYCGIGTVGIIAAKNGCAGLTGFDVNAAAVEDAERNAELNGIRAEFLCAGDKAFEMKNRKHMDVIFADPPRAGCEKRFLQFVLNQKPGRFVYISCNPETLARDLAVMKQGGYEIKRIQPVDMFPGTGHVETVVLMSKKA